MDGIIVCWRGSKKSPERLKGPGLPPPMVVKPTPVVIVEIVATTVVMVLRLLLIVTAGAVTVVKMTDVEVLRGWREVRKLRERLTE